MLASPLTLPLNLPLALFSLVSTSLVVTLAVCYRLLYQVKQCEPDRALMRLTTPEPELPTLTVVIPARNEEINIEACLASWQKVDYPNLDILVADDRSTDQTAACVKRFMSGPLKHSIRLLQDAELDVGDRTAWESGKSYVLWAAARQAQGEWLLFVDADTRQFSEGPWRAMSLVLQRHLKALTVSGLYPNPSFWGDLLENFMLIFMFVIMPLKKINNPSEPLAWMNGQFILFNRASYMAVGGHAAVKAFSFDDMSLARQTKKNGVPALFLPNAQLYECVNYVNLSQATEGWVRWLAGGSPWLGKGLAFFLLGIACILFMVFVPLATWSFLWVMGSDANLNVGPLSTWGLATAHAVTLVILAVGARVGAKRPVWGAFFVHFAAVLAIGILIRSIIVRYFSGVFRFRGRVLKTDKPI